MVQPKKPGNPAQDVSEPARKNRIVIPDTLTLAFGSSLLAGTAAGAPLEIRGVVLEIVPDEGFVLRGGLSVRMSANTRYVGGQAEDLQPATPVQIEGTLADDSAVIATTVTFHKRRRAHSGSTGNE